MQVQDIIDGFRRAGSFFEEPTADGSRLDEQEARLGFRFPATYRQAVEAGSFDKANFHFLEPERYGADDRFVIFAVWNEIRFGFATHDATGDEFRIHPIGDVIEDGTTYPDFPAWFEMVFKMATRPINPD